MLAYSSFAGILKRVNYSFSRLVNLESCILLVLSLFVLLQLLKGKFSKKISRFTENETNCFPRDHTLCVYIVSCLFVCVTQGGWTNTGRALKVTQYNVLEPALANPLGDVETVQVRF